MVSVYSVQCCTHISHMLTPTAPVMVYTSMVQTVGWAYTSVQVTHCKTLALKMVVGVDSEVGLYLPYIRLFLKTLFILHRPKWGGCLLQTLPYNSHWLTYMAVFMPDLFVFEHPRHC